MQDSLEDYLKMTKSAKQEEPVKISQEMIATAQMKKECDARAMKIIEFSIEGKLRPEVFTRCLPFINQSHYQDIVEERAITKLCGYSICGKRIPDMPKKQYFISTKSNKVYDITERKNFCSNFCYKASLHIQNQIDNSPLWLRKLEDIPEYKLLHFSEGGLPGQFIDQGIVKSDIEPKLTSINSFTEASLGDLVGQEINKERNKKDKTKCFKKPSKLKSTMQTIKENEIEEETCLSPVEERFIFERKKEDRKKKCGGKVGKKDGMHHKKSCVLSLPSIEENEERLQAKETDGQQVIVETQIKHERTEEITVVSENIDEKNPHLVTVEERIETMTIKEEIKENIQQPVQSDQSKPKKASRKKSAGSKPKTDIESIMRNSLDDWVTLDTCIFIHGEQKVKEVLTEKKLSDYFEILHVLDLQQEQQIKYMEICRRLQFQELAEEKFDNAMIGNNKLKPLPDYKKLKDDLKDMNLKVTSYYQGSMYEKDDSNFPTKVNSTQEKDGNSEEGPPAVLPPVDVNSQKLMRRKIFLNSLNKAIQQLLQSLGVTYFSTVLSDVQALARTFNLRADNITFKPIVWSYVALVILELLSLKDPTVKEVLEKRRSQDYIKVLFDSLPSKRNFLGDVLTNVKSIELFMERYVTRIEQV